MEVGSGLAFRDQTELLETLRRASYHPHVLLRFLFSGPQLAVGGHTIPPAPTLGFQQELYNVQGQQYLQNVISTPPPGCLRDLPRTSEIISSPRSAAEVKGHCRCGT